MREIDPPFGNPYWDEHIKPHKVSVDEIRTTSLAAFHVVMSTVGVASYYSDIAWDSDPEEIPPLLILHRERAERDLSDLLLRLSVLVRTLDDQMRNSTDVEEYLTFISVINNRADEFMTVYDEANIKCSLRECCNKIIHAQDFRPVYDNGGAPRDEGGFYMTSELELEGQRGAQEWKVSINLLEFLEATVELCSIVSGISD